MKLYHYIYPDQYKNVIAERQGLKPITSLGYTPALKGKKFVFALTEPYPENWVNNQDFSKLVWFRLMANAGNLLLEFDFDEEGSEAFVVDWGHREGLLRTRGSKKVPKKYSHGSREEAEEAYQESTVPLKDYLKRAEELEYSLPEVIIPGSISPERLKVSDQQPELEKEISRAINNENTERLRILRDYLGEIPELHRQIMIIDSWLASHEGKPDELHN
jgi:hypothetical protein